MISQCPRCGHVTLNKGICQFCIDVETVIDGELQGFNVVPYVGTKAKEPSPTPKPSTAQE